MKHITIKAFLKTNDIANKKLTMIFLDDEVEKFTREFLTKYYNNAQNNPIRNNEFYVKFNFNSKCYLDKNKTCIGSMNALVDSVVLAKVYIKNYNFTNPDGRKIIGWNINLVDLWPA